MDIEVLNINNEDIDKMETVQRDNTLTCILSEKKETDPVKVQKLKAGPLLVLMALTSHSLS